MAYRTVGYGSVTNPEVRVIQQKLGLAVDGKYGAKTLEAVKQFQRNKGLKVDGVVGPATWTVLLSAGSGSIPSTTVPSGTVGVGSNVLDKALGVFILYGIFSVLKRAL